jgi:transcriptional regulator with XRE-family HTH domain
MNYRAEREALGMTPERLAELSDCSRSAISVLENRGEGGRHLKQRVEEALAAEKKRREGSGEMRESYSNEAVVRNEAEVCGMRKVLELLDDDELSAKYDKLKGALSLTMDREEEARSRSMMNAIRDLLDERRGVLPPVKLSSRADAAATKALKQATDEERRRGPK